MKKLFTVAAVAVLGLSAFSGCKKSDSAPAYSMNAKINSASFNGSNCVAILVGTSLTLEGGTFSSTLNYPYVSLTIPNYNNATGTYYVGLGGASLDSSSAAIDSGSTIAQIAYGTSGSIVITAVSPNIVGTFSFTCSDGTTVTSGTFTAKKPS